MNIPSKTYLKNLLVLGRVQSVPLTLVPLAVGYYTVSGGGLVDVSIIPLMVIGALAHLGVFAQNDIKDYRYDTKQNRLDKPLVNGSLSREKAMQFCISMIVLSVLMGVLLSTDGAILMMVCAIVLGSIYNAISKETAFGPFIMLLWGVVITAVGGYHAGGYNGTTTAVGLVVGLHMSWIIIQGDYKDIDSEENGIPQLLGVKVAKAKISASTPDDKKIADAQNTIILSMMIVMAETIISHQIMTDGVQSYISLAVLALMLFAMVTSAIYIFDIVYYNRDKIKRRIVIHNAIAVMVVAVALSGIISWTGVAVLGVGTIVWGLGWQKMLYGKALYFP